MSDLIEQRYLLVGKRAAAFSSNDLSYAEYLRLEIEKLDAVITLREAPVLDSRNPEKQ